MAALLGLHQRVNLLWCLTTLLFVLPGAASLMVEGRKGDNITLPCSLTNREDLTPLLTFGHITAFGAGQDEHFRGRVHKNGSCDLILQDLKTTDAGKYISKVFASGQLPNIYTYDIHVNVTLTRQKGEELMFELPREAESVTHLTDTGCTVVWRRGQGVLTDRLTIKDAGLYRVLNSSGGILVTVTVTEPSTSSKDQLDSAHEGETHDTGRVRKQNRRHREPYKTFKQRDQKRKKSFKNCILFPFPPSSCLGLDCDWNGGSGGSDCDCCHHDTSVSEQERGFLPRGPNDRNRTGAQITKQQQQLPSPPPAPTDLQRIPPTHHSRPS